METNQREYKELIKDPDIRKILQDAMGKDFWTNDHIDVINLILNSSDPIDYDEIASEKKIQKETIDNYDKAVNNVLGLINKKSLRDNKGDDTVILTGNASNSVLKNNQLIETDSVENKNYDELCTALGLDANEDLMPSKEDLDRYLEDECLVGKMEGVNDNKIDTLKVLPKMPIKKDLMKDFKKFMLTEVEEDKLLIKFSTIMTMIDHISSSMSKSAEHYYTEEEIEINMKNPAICSNKHILFFNNGNKFLDSIIVAINPNIGKFDKKSKGKNDKKLGQSFIIHFQVFTAFLFIKGDLPKDSENAFPKILQDMLKIINIQHISKEKDYKNLITSVEIKISVDMFFNTVVPLPIKLKNRIIKGCAGHKFISLCHHALALAKEKSEQRKSPAYKICEQITKRFKLNVVYKSLIPLCRSTTIPSGNFSKHINSLCKSVIDNDANFDIFKKQFSGMKHYNFETFEDLTIVNTWNIEDWENEEIQFSD